MAKVTLRQTQLLNFIREWQIEHGYTPSLREVSAHFQINVPTTAQHLRALENKGLIRRIPGKRRSLVLTNAAQDDAPASSSAMPVPASGIRLVGSIPAGSPLSVEEQPEDMVDLSPAWFGHGHMVAVRVMGDSMSGDAIADGDIAIIKLQRSARPAEIAAVRVAGAEVTLKRVQFMGPAARLVPSNPAHPVRNVDADQIEIVGVLAGILRRSQGAGAS